MGEAESHNTSGIGSTTVGYSYGVGSTTVGYSYTPHKNMMSNFGLAYPAHESIEVKHASVSKEVSFGSEYREDDCPWNMKPLAIR